MLGRINSAGGAGGNIINGIIKSYLAENEEITANTFVEFVNVLEPNIDAQISTTDYSTYMPQAVLLNENKVFIAHGGTTNYYLYGTVCTITNNSIISGESLMLDDKDYASQRKSVVVLDENRVFIAYSRADGGSSTSYLYSIVCTIDGTTISKGGIYEIGHVSYTKTIQAHLLSENKVFISFTGNSTIPYCVVCTINNTSITNGNTAGFSSYTYTGYSLFSTVLNENKVFMIRNSSINGSGNKYLRGIVCTIDGTTITFGEDTQLSNVSNSGDKNFSVTLNEDKAFIAHSYNSYLYGTLCTIDDTTISVNESIELDDGTSSWNDLRVIKLNANKVFIYSGLQCMVCIINSSITAGERTILVENGTGQPVSLNENKIYVAYRSSDGFLYGALYIITDTSITSQKNSLIYNKNSSRISSIVALNNNRVFIAHNTDAFTNLYGIATIVDEVPVVIKKSVDKIEGLTKTKCTTAQKGDVWVLNNTEEEI